MIQRLLLNVIVALAYVVGGWLSLHLTVPPHYVSLLFIPAGVGLLAVLLHGPGLLPGIVIGSLGIQWMALVQTQGAQWQWSALVPPVGAAIQAWVTATLIQRVAGRHTPLEDPKQVMRVLFVYLPLGSVINACLSVPVLWSDGILKTDDLLFNWAAWWLGDVLGTMVVTPLLLPFLGQPALVWRPRIKTVALPIGLALLMVGSVSMQLRSGYEKSQQEQFDKVGQDIALRLQRRLDAQADSLVSIAKLMELAPQIQPGDFSAASQMWLQRYAGTQNFGWSPLITHDQRLAYEHGELSPLIPALPIRGRNAAGVTHPAGSASTYLPISWVEPLQTNRQVLGLDISVLPTTSAAVQATLLSGRPSATEGFRLVQESGEQRGVVMYQVVRKHQREAQSTPPPIKGVVSSVFRMDDVLQAVVGPPSPSQPSLCLIDRQAVQTNQRLAGPPSCVTDPAWKLSKPLQLASRAWELRLRPGSDLLDRSQQVYIWVITATGLISIGLLGAFLLVISGQTRRTQQLVSEQTAELARNNATLVALAHYDPLTGLANRASWMQQADAALQAAPLHGKGLGVVFLDLDRFKHVNDSLGHSQGDRLLQVVAERMRSCLRERDVLARLSGDEFVVLLPACRGREGAAVAAQKLVRALAQPISLEGLEVVVSASLGLACFPQDGETIETLLRHADTAMYAVKHSGRNNWRFFSAEMQEHISQRLTMEMGLRRALTPGSTELALHYQPQINTHTGQVESVEALLRWTPPGAAPVPPNVFIQVAEDTGLIDGLGQWVLDTACHQIHQWQNGPDGELLKNLKVSVNISALEFNRPHFLTRLQQTLHHWAIPANRLELEITETLLLQANAELSHRMNAITALGVTLALDDFGTGYSSLGYLKRLPLSKLKVDQSFVRDVPGDAEDEAIIRATLSMAHDLGLRVVAEGVETPEQRDFLWRHGCDELQGWLYSKALPAAALPGWVREHTQAARDTQTDRFSHEAI